jgi:hypothetical protein
MPYTIETIPNEPIVIATADDPFLAEDMPEMWEAAAAQAYDSGTHSFIIYDFSNAKVNQREIAAAILGTTSQNVPGSVEDPNITIAVVGITYAWDIMKSALNDDYYGPVENDIPSFEYLPDAIDYARRSSDNM